MAASNGPTASTSKAYIAGKRASGVFINDVTGFRRPSGIDGEKDRLAVISDDRRRGSVARSSIALSLPGIPADEISDQSSGKRTGIMVGGISLLVLIICTAVIVGTYYGVRGEAPHPGGEEKQFPESSDIPIVPSASVLKRYFNQSVAADAVECSRMGNKILKMGGNAVEAAITAALCAGLYHPHSCGVGGGFFMVHYDRKNQSATSIDAREMAPGLATEKMYVVNKNISSVKGWHAAGVPGEIAGYWEMFKRFQSGNLRWSDLFTDIIRLLRNGVEINAILASAIRDAAPDILQYDAALTSIFSKNGTILVKGDNYTNPKLADTLQTVADDPLGIQEFYHGSVARNLADDVAKGGGIISLKDLEEYRVMTETALHSKLADNSSVYGVPPPAGSLVLQYIMNIMDGYYGQGAGDFSWKDMDDDSKILFYQRFVEAMKFGYARRTEMGDEDFVPAVTQMKETLVRPWFAQLTRVQIPEDKTFTDPRYYGVKTTQSLGKHGTSHISIIDKDGNAVSLTTTINTHFGSRRVSQSTGIILNNEMDDFSTNPNEPNFYGLPPSRANFVAPKKRPQSSCSPIIVVDASGQVKISIGASGGSRIISATANAILRVLYLKENVKEAIDAPRLHHQLLPMRLDYEPGFTNVHLRGLDKMGHELKVVQFPYAVVQGLVRLPDGSIEANSDHRKNGGPAGDDE